MVSFHVEDSCSGAGGRGMAGQVLQEVSRIALEATELNGPRSGIRGLVGGVVEAIGAVGEEVAAMLEPYSLYLM